MQVYHILEIVRKNYMQITPLTGKNWNNIMNYGVVSIFAFIDQNGGKQRVSPMENVPFAINRNI